MPTRSDIDLTDEETKAIASLERVAKKWPKSLWLFSASGSLNVMKKREDGTKAYLQPDPQNRGEPVDQDYSITTINIENDGGDW
ncbi:MAG: hypothetical protein QNM00_01310 [Gammaproteobacteria bacterium]|nr:hypothetical protein [Gammaproteobacteria bacterium]